MKTILLSILLACSMHLQAKDIRIVVPYSPGGANDRIARIIEKDLSNSDYNFVVEFKPGANGAIGARAVANTKNETVLMIAANGFILAPLMGQSLGYDPAADFKLVRYLGADSLLLVVKNDGQIKSFKDFMRVSQTQSMPYGTAGIGSMGHLTGSTIAKNNKNFIHVPYKGASQVLPDLLNGNLKWTIDAVQNVNSFIAAGKLIPIAAYTPTRIPEYPSVPTVKELGINDHNLARWYAVMANSDADPAVVLYVRTRLSEKAIQNKLQAMGIATGEYSGDFVQLETNKMKQVLRYIDLE
jgi:tripartite-type tricarboxylate transporter receptor subunit TctC